MELQTIANSVLAAPVQLEQIPHRSHKSTNKRYGQTPLVRGEFVHKVFVGSGVSTDKIYYAIWRTFINLHLDSLESNI